MPSKRMPSVVIALTVATAASCLSPDADQRIDGLGASLPDAGQCATDARPHARSILVEPQTLTIVEGQTQPFKVKLSAQPTAPVTVALAASPAIALAAPTITFDPRLEDATVGKDITVAVGVDDNTVDESLEIALVAPDHAAASLRVLVDDQDVDGPTVRDTVGDSTYHDNTVISRTAALAEPLVVSRTMCIDRLQLITTASTGQAKLALFTSVADKPGALLVEAPPFDLRPRTDDDPFSVGAISPSELAPGRYWIAVLVNSTTPLGHSLSAARRCRQSGTANFRAPIQFGFNPACADNFSLNLSASGTVGRCPAP